RRDAAPWRHDVDAYTRDSSFLDVDRIAGLGTLQKGFKNITIETLTEPQHSFSGLRVFNRRSMQDSTNEFFPAFLAHVVRQRQLEDRRADRAVVVDLRSPRGLHSGRIRSEQSQAIASQTDSHGYSSAANPAHLSAPRIVEVSVILRSEMPANLQIANQR